MGSGIVNVDFGSAISAIGNAADSLFTSKEEELAIHYKTQKLDVDLLTGQMEVNIAEANSGKSWRHWVGRVGAVSLALYFIPQYLIAAIIWCKVCWGIQPINGLITLPVYPASADALLELITGMLGLGIIKAVENINGVSKQKTTKTAENKPWYRRIF